MKLAETLVEYKDIFAWSSSNLGIMPCHISKHKHGISEETKLVFQKKRTFAKARQEVIKKGVKELLEVEIIKPTDFPECLSNPIGGN